VYAASAVSDVALEELTGQIEPGESVPERTSGISTAAAASFSAMDSAGGSLSGPQSSVNTIHFDPVSGAGVLSLPLFSPTARSGLKPSLILNYSPRSGNDVFGLGWSIGFGSIERSTRDGIVSYDESDTFIAEVDGANFELVKISEGRYRAKVEGLFYNFQYDGQRWQMRNGKGLTYYFGEDHLYHDRSRLQNPQGKTFQWRLSRVEDAFGNYYLIRYSEDDSFELFWTGEPGTARGELNVSSQKFFARAVSRMEEFDRDDPILSYRAGFARKISRRVKDIEIYAAGELQRVYHFNYSLSGRSGRSVLESIRECGSDDQTCLPDIQFEYSQGGVEYGLSGIMGDPLKGDNLWAFKKNKEGYDRGHDTYGPVPPWHFSPLTEAFTGLSWNGAGSWTQDGRGRFRLSGLQDNGYYFYTYFYVQQPKTIQAQFSKNQWNPGFWLNGNYSQSVSETQWPLQAGYNLFEYTDYHQHSSFYSELLTDIASQVDLMNSSQVLIPQLAGDFNGDGFADAATYFSSTGKVKVALSNGGAFLAKETWLDTAPINSQPILGDFDADGRTDLAFFERSSGVWTVHRSGGSGFGQAQQWISGFGQNEMPSTGDFNGDGLSDAVSFYDESGRKKARVALNKGPLLEPAGQGVDIGIAGSMAFTADFNGDGLADLGAFDPLVGRWDISLNKGEPGLNFVKTAEAVNFGANKQMTVTDVNGDGMADIGYFEPDIGAARFRCSKAETFEEQDYELPFSFHLRGADVQLQSSDFNGDGIVDFIAYNLFGNSELAYSNGIMGDLLTAVDNNFGARTAVSYLPSTAYSNEYLPFVIPLISSVEISNSRDYTMTERYFYEGGLWKPEDRAFYGFKKVRVVDPMGRFTETVFLQDDYYLRGRPASAAFYQPDGRRISETVNTWEVKPLFSDARVPVRFPCLTWKKERTYAEDGIAGVELKTWNTFSVNTQFGVAHQSFQWFMGVQDLKGYSNEIDNSRYSVQRETQVVSNFSDTVWIVNLPRQEGETGSGYQRKQEYFYDGANYSGALPVKGVLTQRNVLDPSNASVKLQTVKYEYDSYGNLVSETDPEGHRSSLEFDAVYHAFPVRRVDPMGHISEKGYYGIGDVGVGSDDGCRGLVGQIFSATDINGVSIRYDYDALGRLVKVIGPDDTYEFPSELYEYRFFSDHAVILHSLRRESNSAKTIRSARFSDGLGRFLQAKTLSGKPESLIVSGQKVYDALGRVEKEFYPRTVMTGLDVLDEIDEGLPNTRYEYDERDRLIEKKYFDGTRQSLSYAMVPKRAESAVFETDANGHRMASYSDALGRVIRIEEYKGSDGRCPLYPQQAYELYAQTRYEYDGQGRILRVLDAQGNTTQIAYDKLGRKTVMDDPDMGRWEYGYDKNGNLKWQVDAQGRRLDFAYDALNRPLNKTDGDQIDVVYTYDRQDLPYSKGRLGLVEYGPMGDGDWTEFQYDRFGREVRSQKTIDGQPYQVQRIYDSMGNLTGVIYPDGTAVYYHFNGAGQLDGVANDPELLDDEAVSSSWLSSSGGFWRWAGRMAACLFGVKEAHAQETYREASIISPQPGSTISSLPLSISWDPGLNVSHYYLYIGSSRGGSDIYSAYLYGSRLDLSDIQLKGGSVYFRLWSYIAYQGWKYKDYEYQSVSLGAASAPAEILSPVPGSVVSSSPLQISWSPGVRVGGYYLYIGSSPGAADLYVKYFPNNGVRTVSVNVPINGASLHVRIWSYLSEGRWEFKDYTFSTAGNQTIVPAKMTSPVPGTLISQDQPGFQWDKGEGVLQYWIYFGTQQGGADILNRNMDLSTSLTASVPRTGQPLYVRLWSRTSLGWKYFDYQYLTRSPNQKPVVAINGDTVLNGTPLELSVVATDEDEDQLEFLRPEAGDLPLGCDFKIISSSAGRLEGRLSWSPTAVQQGDHTIPVEVKDSEETVSKTIEIQVVAGMRTEEPRVYISDIQYTALGQTERILYGNGVSTVYEYDPLNFRLARIVTADADEKVLQDLSYEYDAVGNIVAIRDGVRLSTQRFEYDHLNRLVLASNDATYGTQTYGYDRVGNILEKGGVSYRYAESGSRVGGAAAGPHAVTSLGNGTVFQYDASGNMVRKERSGAVSSFEFDAEGRLRQVFQNGEHRVRFAYDGDGGRVKKIVYGALSGGGVSAMAFPELLEGNGGAEDLVTHVIGQLYEKTNVDQTKHIFAGDRRIASVKNGEVAFIHPDHLGSANLVTDHDGLVSEIIEYQPFGSFSRHERLGGAENGSAYFTGQRLDDETGLYYYESRYYDPDLGRFISADTVVPGAGDPQAFNRYAYVRNNPVVMVDPDGHGWFIAAIIGALIGGISGGVMAYNNDRSAWKGAFWGGLQGFLSGAALGTPFSSIEKQGYWWGLTRVSGGLSLGGQVAGAAGWSEGQQALNYAAMGTAGLYAGVNVLKGIKDWAYENRFGFVRKDGAGDFVQSGERVFINGVTTPLETQGRWEGALEQAWKSGADVLAYNPSSGPIADLVEAGLGKLTFTSSLSRQISNRLIGLNGIHLAGFSQGGIIAANVALNLGLSDHRTVLSSLTVGSSQISQLRAVVTGAIGGGLQFSNKTLVYGTGSAWDFSGFLAPNLNPKYFLGGAVGTAALPVGIQNHYWPY